MSNPRLSILIPMRNAERFIAATLRSLLSQEGLDPACDEIVVIDDGSTDGSRALVQQLRGEDTCGIRIIDGPRAGISAAMNAGLGAAKGEWIARCDADDLYPPGRLARQMNFLHSHPDFGAVCASFCTITSKGRPIADMATGTTDEEITNELRNGTVRTHFGTFLSRADALQRAGGFRPWFITAEDVDLQLRLGEVCRVGYEPIVSYAYRLHDASITHQQADARRVFYDSTAKMFSTQRRETGADDLQRGAPPPSPAESKNETVVVHSANRQVQQVLIGKSWKHHQAGQKLRAIMTGFRACLMGPGNISVWKSLGALAMTQTKRVE